MVTFTILTIAYKFFSSLLHLRLRRQLDYQQSVDQVGFTLKTNVDHAFIVSKKNYLQNVGMAMRDLVCYLGLAESF